MYGTLARALAVRKVDFDRDRFQATVEGRIEPAGSTIRITEIHMRYTLVIPASDRAATDRALQAHPAGCPAHESVKESIRVTWDAEIEEV